MIYLRDIADIDQENGRSKILHSGAKRIQTITCNVHKRDIGNFAKEMKGARVLNDVAPYPG